MAADSNRTDQVERREVIDRAAEALALSIIGLDAAMASAESAAVSTVTEKTVRDVRAQLDSNLVGLRALVGHQRRLALRLGPRERGVLAYAEAQREAERLVRTLVDVLDGGPASDVPGWNEAAGVIQDIASQCRNAEERFLEDVAQRLRASA
jgi:hypothetical protein